MTVSGSNFGTYDTSPVAAIAWQDCELTKFVSDSSLLCKMPSGAGTQDVLVTVEGQSLAAVSVGFAYDPPAVSSIAPRNGVAAGGTQLSVFGSNFGTVDFTPAVSIGAVSSTIANNNVWTSDSSMEAHTPAGQSQALDVFVVVYGFATSFGSLTEAWSYDLPSLTGISRGNGPTSGTPTITIYGKNLVSPATLAIGGTSATGVSVLSTTSVQLVVPAGIGASQEVSGSFDGDTAITFLNFTYDAPSVTSIDPRNSQTAGGDSITIFGSNFGAASEIASVSASIGSTACSAVASDAAHLSVVCTVVEGISDGLSVVVTVAAQVSGANSFFSFDAPVVQTLDPNFGVTAGGFNVTVTGNNFGLQSSSRTADLGDTACTEVYHISHTALECLAPSGFGDSLALTVAVDGLTGSALGVFSYEGPSITAISPPNGPAAGSIAVTFTGLSFGVEDPGPTASIDGKNCLTSTWTSDSSLSCNVAGNVGNAKAAAVVIAGQTGAAVTIFSYDGPVLTRLNPASGPTSGSALTATGLNFGISDSTPDITIGNTAAAVVTWKSDTSISLTSGAGGGTSFDAAVDVAAQTNSLTNAFSYQPPTITALLYVAASTDGGDSVTIIGTNFGPSASVRSATVGSTAAAVTYSSHTAAVLTVAAGTGKGLEVAVTVDGQSGTYGACGLSECKFSYDAPVITAVTPRYGPSSGATEVTIFGSNFGQFGVTSATATLNSVTCSAATVVSSASVTCTLGANAFTSAAVACTQCNAFQVEASVTVDSQTGTLASAFSYSNDGSSASLAGLWCNAIKVAHSSTTDGLVYIDPDGDADTR